MWAGGAWREIPADVWQQTTGVGQEEAESEWLEQVVEQVNSTGMEIPKRGDDGSLLEVAPRGRLSFRALLSACHRHRGQAAKPLSGHGRAGGCGGFQRGLRY